MRTSDIPPEVFDSSSDSHLQAAYRIAGALTKGELPCPERGMVVHQWALHMKEVISPTPPLPNPVRRWSAGMPTYIKAAK
jgi:hypothetical protein